MTERTFDVAVVGGGMVGMSLAAGLSGAGVATALVERARIAGSAGDGRASAIAAGSRRILDGLGLWSGMAADAEPIRAIRVADGAAPLFLHFDERELGEGPLGWIVENSAIRRALEHAVLASGAVVVAGRRAARIVPEPHRVRVLLDGGDALAARLAVAADGRDSPLRRAAGIEARRWTYPQTAVVCSVAHELPHRGVAHERFLPSGPFAILPMTGNRSSIVWTERTARARALLSLDDAGFAAELRARFGAFLGEVAPLPGRWSHPLSAVLSASCAGPRLALAGDAVRAIHPVAGQGLNLGLRDVAALAQTTVDAMRLGLDPGAPAALDAYRKWRRGDGLAMLAATDGLNRLFSNDLPALGAARALGLGLVHRIRPLKRLFMRRAMGIAGELPRLSRGLPL